MPEDFLLSRADFSKSFLKHWRLIHPRCAAPELCIASACSDPESSEARRCLGRVRDPVGTQVTIAGRTKKSGRLRVKQKDRRDDLSPSLTSAVNQANHSASEFRTSDLSPSCGIQSLCPHTATSTAPANM